MTEVSWQQPAKMVRQLMQHLTEDRDRYLLARHAQAALRRRRHHAQRTTRLLRQIGQHRRVTRPHIWTRQQHHRHRPRRPSSHAFEGRGHAGQHNGKVMEEIMRGGTSAHESRRIFYKRLSMGYLEVILK